MKTVLWGAMLFALCVTVVWLNSFLRERTLRARWDECLKQAREITAGVKAQYPGCEGVMCLVTTEPGVRVARSKDITLEDYQDAIDRVDPGATPYLSYCKTQRELKAVDTTWNVDTFPTPKGAVGRADNEAAPTSGDAGSHDVAANIRKVGNVAQAFSRTWRRGWIMDIPKIAGVKNIDAYAQATYTEALKTDMEAAFSSFDQVAVYDQGPKLGAVAAGYRKLTDDANKYAAASAYAIGKPSDLHFAPTGACVTGALSAVHNRALWKTIALQLRIAAKKKGDWLLIAGLTLRQAVTDLVDPATTQPGNVSAIAATQTRVLSRAESDNVLGATVDVIQTDYGRILVTDSDYIGTTTTDVTGGALSGVNTLSAHRVQASFVSNLKSGILLKKGNCFKQWAKMPYREKLANDGGGDAYDLKAMATHGLSNPTLAGWLLLT
jgi:hypothetical protein